MKIDNSNTEVSFSFRPRDYFLVHGKDDRFPNADLLVWSLNPRIDMSYKGKDDQVAIATIYLTDAEAESCKNAGFTWIEE